jgi:hypothetical protein
MRSSAVLSTLCVSNLLFVPMSIVEAAAYPFTVSPLKRMVSSPATTYPASAPST